MRKVATIIIRRFLSNQDSKKLRILAIGDYFKQTSAGQDGKELYRRRAFFEVGEEKGDDGVSRPVAVQIMPTEVHKHHRFINVLHETEDLDRILGSGGLEFYDL